MHLGNIEGAVVTEDLQPDHLYSQQVKRTVKRNWLNAKVTHQEQRLENVHDIFIMEKLTYLMYQSKN